VGLLGALDHDEPVRPDGGMRPADGPDELVDPPDLPQSVLAVVDENEVVPAPLDPVKLDHGYLKKGLGL